MKFLTTMGRSGNDQGANGAMSKLSNLEFFQLVAASGEAPSELSRFIYPPTIAKTLGFKLIEVGPGSATIEIVTDIEKHGNPMALYMEAFGAISLMRPSEQPMRRGWNKPRASRVSICRSISFVPHGMDGFAQ